jgi:Raf kinase inhibitor-like YbhB/YbcL family protein
MNAIERSRNVGSPVVRRLVALPTVLVALAMIAAGCKHDGRVLRPALPSQNGSVSTSAAPTVPETEDNFFDTIETDPALVPGGPIEPSTTVLGGASVATLAPLASLVSSLVVTVPWRDGGPIDPRYSCKGLNVAPALSWTAAPEGTQEIAITMVDQDIDFDHWAMTGIAPDVTALAEGATPAGAVAALNGTGTTGYTGPCPPSGATHTYRITVHYLDSALQLTAGGPAADMRDAIDAATIATAQVSGTFTGS